MEFGEVEIGEVFRWRGRKWEKHKPSYARPHISYPRAKNTETFFPEGRKVELVHEDN